MNPTEACRHDLPPPPSHVLSKSELVYWLRLTLSGPLGVSPLRLLSHFGSPRAVFHATYARLAALCPAPAALLISASPCAIVQARINQALQWASLPGHTIVTIGDANYPKALLNLPDPPLVLYVDGQVHALDVSSLAIVGARNATAQGKENAFLFAQALAAHGLCIVSGFAQGIDAAAHAGALAAASQGSRHAGTIAVLGTGIDITYPVRHRLLAQRIRENGALISELPLGSPPAAHHFPKRNRLVAGLALGVLVIEAARQSGSLITARLASENGREVFALPGSIHSPLARGCHALIQQGAKLIETVDDILIEIAAQWTPPSATNQGTLFDAEASAPPASPIAALHDALGFDPVDTDTLLVRTGWPMAELACALMTMELEGQLSRLDDGRYQRMKR